MKSITFHTNTHTCNTRDITELVRILTAEDRLVDTHVVVMFRDAYRDETSPLMITVLFDVLSVERRETENITKRFVYRMYRADDFSCFNQGLELVEKFEDYENKK